MAGRFETRLKPVQARVDRAYRTIPRGALFTGGQVWTAWDLLVIDESFAEYDARRARAKVAAALAIARRIILAASENSGSAWH